jgi:hypothetical protein
MKKLTSLFIFALATLFGSAHASAACSVADERVCAIDAKLQAYAAVNVEYVDQAPSGDAATAVEYAWVAPGKHIIRIGNTRGLDNKALMFALSHEYGHAAANHGRKLVEHVTVDKDLHLSDAALLEKYGFHASAVKPSLKVFNHRQVVEADLFAASALKSFGQDPLPAMEAALPGGVATSSHPAAADRITKVKAILAVNS